MAKEMFDVASKVRIRCSTATTSVQRPFTQWKHRMNELYDWSLFSVLLLWALMISISILPGETRYLRAPSLSPVRNSVDSFDLIIVVFRFCGKRVKEKQRRAAVEGRGERAGERENADTGILP